MAPRVAPVDFAAFSDVTAEAARAHLVAAFRVLRALGQREPNWLMMVRAWVDSAWQEAADHQHPDEHLCGGGK